ncbi:hypothetical protein [Massilia soli]|uniref:Uncharacterized protein n=1 Tax=Massilia soli TaxID=2792854 RepID=A0ABS7SU84_9BURK|nr:hypothetical protein [Massilia soli]MBZ2209523.1 hypothetical protein [Massilia soli]
MKRLVTLVTLLTLSGAALAGGRSDAMQVSFVIKEACVIQSAAQNTTVRCNVDAPFQIQHAPQPAPSSIAAPSPKTDAAVTVITF